MSKPEILIVGINNFLGKAIYRLTQNQYSITGVYNTNKENIPANVELIHVDLITELKDRDFKQIYLISSYVPKDNLSADDQKLVETNIVLPKIISSLFPDSRIIFCSSVSVLESPDQISKYALSKLWGERLIETHASYGIIRISSMYGVGMKRVTFIPKIIENAIANRNITLLGDGQRMQNYINVDDVANIAVKLANRSENITLLAASDRSYTNKEIAQMILEIIPGQLKFTGTDNSTSKLYNIDEVYEKLGEIAFKPIKDGLRELIEWIKKQF